MEFIENPGMQCLRMVIVSMTDHLEYGDTLDLYSNLLLAEYFLAFGKNYDKDHFLEMMGNVFDAYEERLNIMRVLE